VVVGLILLRIRRLARNFNLMKELVSLSNPEDFGKASPQFARPLVANSIDDFLENATFNLLFFGWLVLISGFFSGAEQHCQNLLQCHRSIKAEKKLSHLRFLISKRI
jgi:hypothetical protein